MYIDQTAKCSRESATYTEIKIRQQILVSSMQLLLLVLLRVFCLEMRPWPDSLHFERLLSLGSFYCATDHFQIPSCIPVDLISFSCKSLQVLRQDAYLE